MSRHTRQPARGTVLVIVLWAIAVAAVICGSVQLFAYRQANMGSETLGRIRARWAARAGVENTIAVMAEHTERPYDDDAFAIVRDMYAVAAGDLPMASYDIYHFADHKIWAGPMDEHSKLNVNLGNRGFLLILDDMTFEIADAISDWIDDNDEVDGFFGAERDYYLSLDSPYEPRNGSFRSIAELELVAGLWPEYLRGEDWNLNNRIDPNENDGNTSFPNDEPDDDLEANWSGQLTPYSVDGGATASGLPRLRFLTAGPAEVAERLGVTPEQAQILRRFGANPTSRMEQLLMTPLSAIGGQANNPDLDLDDEQIAAAMAEMTIGPAHERGPGKININTVSSDLFRDIVGTLGLDEALADEILYIRDGRAEGIVSLIDLKDIAEESGPILDLLGRFFTTSSNVYTISARGYDATGMEVEIVAVVDRSTVPVKILEYREQ